MNDFTLKMLENNYNAIVSSRVAKYMSTDENQKEWSDEDIKCELAKMLIALENVCYNKSVECTEYLELKEKFIEILRKLICFE